MRVSYLFRFRNIKISTKNSLSKTDITFMINTILKLSKQEGPNVCWYACFLNLGNNFNQLSAAKKKIEKTSIPTIIIF